MPVSNKRGPFKCRTAKLLAEQHDLSQHVFSGFSQYNKFISIEDVHWLIDNINYDLNGKAIYNNSNVPKQKRYDKSCPFNGAYTRDEFRNFYGKNFWNHWLTSKIYIPHENETI